MSHRPPITIEDIQKIPEGHLHSKISFLKSILSEEDPQQQLKREKILKQTYTIKNIGIHGEQIGITSKRVLLKDRENVDTLINPESHYYQPKHIPKSSFYSQPLQVCHKKENSTTECNKQESELAPKNQTDHLLSINTRRSWNEFTQQSVDHIESLEPKPSTMNTTRTSVFRRTFHSISAERLNAKKSHMEKQKRLIESMSPAQLKRNSQPKDPKNKSHIQNRRQFLNKKSFARLLQECKVKDRNGEVMVPVQHEENPLFKKIQKIKSVYKEQNQQRRKKEEFDSLRRTVTNSTVFLGRYNTSSRNRFTSSEKARIKEQIARDEAIKRETQTKAENRAVQEMERQRHGARAKNRTILSFYNEDH